MQLSKQTDGQGGIRTPKVSRLIYSQLVSPITAPTLTNTPRQTIRVGRFELPSAGPKPAVLPLYDTRILHPLCNCQCGRQDSNLHALSRNGF